MSRPQLPQPAKLIVGLLLKDKRLLPEVADALQTSFGRLEMASLWFDFKYTDYYAPEMGSPLFRRMLVFQHLIAQEALADIKCRTNALESRFSRSGRRRVNLDPGYLLYERFVLATGKNYTHRIYVGRGIYADLTLVYQKGTYQPLPWTYPDYASAEMRDFLGLVRRCFASEITARRSAGTLPGAGIRMGEKEPFCHA